MLDRTPGSIRALLVGSDEDAYLAWNLAALCPWMTVAEPPATRRKALVPPPALVARQGFRAPNKLADILAASYRHREEITELKAAVCRGESFIHERDRFGMAIRRWDAEGGSWGLQVLSALLVDAMEHLQAWSGHGTTGKSESQGCGPPSANGWPCSSRTHLLYRRLAGVPGPPCQAQCLRCAGFETAGGRPSLGPIPRCETWEVDW